MNYLRKIKSYQYLIFRKPKIKLIQFMQIIVKKEIFPSYGLEFFLFMEGIKEKTLLFHQ